ncbi:Alkanesulfonate monooxygenase [Azotobacter vinelandii CA]|uniref:Alkanesulfonate monooxygenase n=2 Tax=Azotobacter vinelandii TaxID=354 RepID=C1DID4_AZOVD|nr:LLM class flavin-dependent oxidoreductase [Azotobacter vinelandii]ACO76631.1 Alkanesulfonate monooxygenase [Azotobacter vinelandii DJ]AGK15628.1 Alkanesulfonate monooxygenase [Azotobacter vinelandii CA]AGK19249.1 Alkanesulfonate monooxygenase [Azotobacter vinelandii CA6]WKN22387.1 LLM class flavin-dependent oxidoreductase [Azotobacter vinelandii]SFX12550.1 alkanesulfonate monooxygenase [Azotobacter vinelandii]
MLSVSRLEFIGVLPARDIREPLPPGAVPLDKAYLGACARALEHGGFGAALIGWQEAAPDGLQVAAHVAQQTRRLGLLVAHRPGLQAPTEAARQFATLDHFSDGRAALRLFDDGGPQSDGDFLERGDWPARSDEYLTLLRRAWSSTRPFDFDGRHYRVKGHLSALHPLQARLPIHCGGASPAAARLAGRHADVYAMAGEPLATVAVRIGMVRAAAAREGRAAAVRFGLSLRVVLGASEAEAWSRAGRLLPFASRGQVFDDCLWCGLDGDSATLVGTPGQIAEAFAAYHRLGVESFLVRGFDPLADAIEFGRELLPRVRERIPLRLPIEAFAPF